MNVHISKTGNDNTIGEIRLLENVSAVKRNNAAAAHREIFPRKAAVVKTHAFLNNLFKSRLLVSFTPLLILIETRVFVNCFDMKNM